MFNTDTYEKIFKKYLDVGETTRGDEVLVDMDEPRGQKISYLPMRHAHSVVTCKAFVATTTMGRIFVAIFDIYGKFHKCYCTNCINDLRVEKGFGGSYISFVADTQYGKLKMEMYVANRQFGTDLKNQKEHKELLIKHLDDISKNVKEAEIVKSTEEKIDYPVSELIKNALKLTSSWGQEFYEPLGVQVVCYNGKEYLYYAEDKYYNTVLIYTGNPESLKEGFVLEGKGGGTCKKVGTYKYLYSGAYYKEVKKEELECSFHRTFFALYNDNGCKFSLIDIEEDRVTLQLSMDVRDMPQGFDAKRLQAEGFEATFEAAEHPYAWCQDKWIFTKRGVPYNDPKLKIFVHRHYYGSDRLDETEEFSFL